MLFVRATRNAREASRYLVTALSSSKNYHSSKAHEKSILKCSCCLNSRVTLKLNHFKHSNLSVNYCSIAYKKSHSTSAFTPEEKKDQFNSSKCIYIEHPDVANLSEDDVENFRKLKNITVKGTDIPKPITKFNELHLPVNLMGILDKENYSEPTPIQSQGWPVALSQRDMVGVSQTGSGKTLAYMLPAIVHASNQRSSKVQRSHRTNSQIPKVLVLGPTRELVQQIHQVSVDFMQSCNLRSACVYGGSSKMVQLRHLQGAEICIATPGRLLDYVDNCEVSLKNCTYLVLDEADRMLDMGFEPQIRAIINQIPCERQTLMWSATWPKEIKSLAEDFLTNYIHITVGSTELVANPNIQQNIYHMKEEEKFGKLLSLLNNVLENKQSKVLIFAETKRKVDLLSDQLQRQSIMSWGIHGDCSQRQRDSVLHRFRSTTPSVLIATDIASRGLDISDIHHVVNYDFPQNIEDYIHRIGRTARGSACGESHSFLTSQNYGVLKDLISVLKQSNQHIDPDLYELSQRDSPIYNRKRYNYGKHNFTRKSYARNNYGRNNYGTDGMYSNVDSMY